MLNKVRKKKNPEISLLIAETCSSKYTACTVIDNISTDFLMMKLTTVHTVQAWSAMYSTTRSCRGQSCPSNISGQNRVKGSQALLGIV
jgi:hypothetical protein